MAHELTIYQSGTDPRLQRRIRFSAHMAVYVLFCIVQGMLLPHDLFALGLRSLLFMTVIAHVSWLCSAPRPLLADWQPVPQPIPLLPEGQRRIQARQLPDNDFWYRWHDLT